ncbi:MAG: hypothetical protein NTX25_22610, partial [Proteobacteria bacterium]|nr:hypothetical protein [Pseudomonadota bacterium]
MLLVWTETPGDFFTIMTAKYAPLEHLDISRARLASALYKALSAIQGGSLPESITPAWFYSSLERPPEAHLGDYALPCFRLAKDLKRKPPEIAGAIAAVLTDMDPEWIEKLETAGPFLNVSLRPGALAQILVPALRTGTYFAALKSDGQHRLRVMIEYSQPNTHKAFHVGHMRNVALG